MVGWHHRLNGHGFGWTPGAGDGQGGLACCSPWGRKESDTTEGLNKDYVMYNTSQNGFFFFSLSIFIGQTHKGDGRGSTEGNGVPESRRSVSAGLPCVHAVCVRGWEVLLHLQG